LQQLSEPDAARLLGTEHYRRAEVGSRDEVFIEPFATRVPVGGGT